MWKLFQSNKMAGFPPPHSVSNTNDLLCAVSTFHDLKKSLVIVLELMFVILYSKS